MNGNAIDLLAKLFIKCAELNIKIPDDMPLDTPAHQKAACRLLSQAISYRRAGRHFWLDGPHPTGGPDGP
jgi:hypothetical protein